MTRTSSEPVPTTIGTASLIQAPRVRWGMVIAAVVVGSVVVAVGSAVPETTRWYVATLALAAAPFATAGLVLATQARRWAPPSYRPFWTRWLAASATAYAGGAAGLLAAVTDVSALYGLAAALLVAAVPLWFAAGVQMQRAQGGRRAVSVDVLDALTALVVLGAPAVLVVAEPLLAADQPLFALPFVASVVLVPGGLYLSLRNLRLVPPGERTTQGIATALGAAFALNLSVQIAHVLSDFALPMGVLVACQVLNMALLMAVPLWAHRRPTSVLDELAPERQVRGADPLALVSAALLPALGVLAYAGRDERPWGVPFVIGVAAVALALGSARNLALRRETDRLYGEVARLADERRQLLVRMVDALEADRRRVAVELHAQAVASFAALGAVEDGARLALAPDAAAAVGVALAEARDDLRTRAESLRRLLTACQVPPADGHDGALASALRALGADLLDGRAAGSLDVVVDPGLELDWSTTTIVHRIAREAMLDAAHGRHAARIEVAVGERDGAVVVAVTDDGAAGSVPSASLALVAELGGGSVVVEHPAPELTVVRAVLAAPGAPTGGHRPARGAAAGPTLVLVPGGRHDGPPPDGGDARR